MITIEQAKQLRRGDIIYTPGYYNADKSLQRWKVTGKVKTWKRDSSRISIPIKRGLYDFWYLTEDNLHGFTLTEKEG